LVESNINQGLEESMKFAKLCLLAFACAVTPISANADRVQEKVKEWKAENIAFLAQFPAFGPVEDAIKSDCAAKISGQLPSGPFCECAAAVTVGLWRADPKMLKRVADYIKHPDPSRAASFLDYQGPELYRPVCELAQGR